MTLPRVFQVGVEVPLPDGGDSKAYGGGRLTVSRDAVELRPGPLTRHATKVDCVVHTSRSVVILTRRFAVPYLNTKVVLDGGDTVAFVRLPGWQRKGLRDALLEGGYKIEDRRTWAAWASSN